VAEDRAVTGHLPDIAGRRAGGVDLAQGERASAQLESWKIRCCPHRATTLVRAVLVLIHAG
jgi:hypothetical protein